MNVVLCRWVQAAVRALLPAALPDPETMIRTAFVRRVSPYHAENNMTGRNAFLSLACKLSTLRIKL